MRNHLPVGAIRQQQLWNNIHCVLLTGSPSLPSPWRLLTEAGVLLGSGVFFLPFTEKGEIPSMGIEQKKKEKVNAWSNHMLSQPTKFTIN